MECTLCHIKYIGKSETQFNLRLKDNLMAEKPVFLKPASLPICRNSTIYLYNICLMIIYIIYSDIALFGHM